MASKKWIEEHQEEMKAYRRKYYQANKESEQKRIIQRKKDLQEWFKEYKKTLKCERCGETHPACLDFHHLDPTEKEIGLAEVVGTKGWGKERILKEINKCIILCANCHRKEHYKEE